MYLYLRSLIRSIGPIDKILMYFLTYFRVKKSKKIFFLNYAKFEDLSAIIENYKYSILKTHRPPSQVMNIEILIKHITNFKIDGDIVEAGVFTGGSSAFMLLSILRNEGFNKRTFWGFDSFEGMPAPTKKDGNKAIKWIYGNSFKNENVNGELISHKINKTDYLECYEYLKNTNYPKKYIKLIKGWFQNTINTHKNNIKNISILRIDADFYESTLFVLSNLYDKVSKNGVIIIDDYGSFEGCRKAVDEFFEKRNLDKSIITFFDDQIVYFFKY